MGESTMCVSHFYSVSHWQQKMRLGGTWMGCKYRITFEICQNLETDFFFKI